MGSAQQAFSIGFLDFLFGSVEGSVEGHVCLLSVTFILIQCAGSSLHPVYTAGSGTAVAIASAGMLLSRHTQTHQAMWASAVTLLCCTPLLTFARYYGSGGGAGPLAFSLLLPFFAIHLTKTVEGRYTRRASPLHSKTKMKGLPKVIPFATRNIVLRCLGVYHIVVPTGLYAAMLASDYDMSGDATTGGASTNPSRSGCLTSPCGVGTGEAAVFTASLWVLIALCVALMQRYQVASLLRDATLLAASALQRSGVGTPAPAPQIDNAEQPPSPQSIASSALHSFSSGAQGCSGVEAASAPTAGRKSSQGGGGGGGGGDREDAPSRKAHRRVLRGALSAVKANLLLASGAEGIGNPFRLSERPGGENGEDDDDDDEDESECDGGDGFEMGPPGEELQQSGGIPAAGIGGLLGGGWGGHVCEGAEPTPPQRAPSQQQQGGRRHSPRCPRNPLIARGTPRRRSAGGSIGADASCCCVSPLSGGSAQIGRRLSPPPFSWGPSELNDSLVLESKMSSMLEPDLRLTRRGVGAGGAPGHRQPNGSPAAAQQQQQQSSRVAPSRRLSVPSPRASGGVVEEGDSRASRSSGARGAALLKKRRRNQAPDNEVVEEMAQLAGLAGAEEEREEKDSVVTVDRRRQRRQSGGSSGSRRSMRGMAAEASFSATSVCSGSRTQRRRVSRDAAAESVSYEDQIFSVWHEIDRDGVGTLGSEDLSALLAICGVRCDAGDMRHFLQLCVRSGGVSSFLTFSALFEDFRLEGVFDEIYSRTRITAMIDARRDPASQLRAHQAIENVAGDAAAVTSAEALSVLQALGLPCQPYDLQLLREELDVSGDLFDPADLLDLFVCNHPSLLNCSIEPGLLVAARRALVSRKVYSTSQQAQKDLAVSERDALEAWNPLVLIYVVIAFSMSVMEAAFGVRQPPLVVAAYLLADLVYFVLVLRGRMLPYELDGHFVFSRQEIARSYLGSWRFATDVVGLFPLDVVGIAVEGAVSRSPLYRLNKAILVLNIHRLAFDTFGRITKSPTVVRILQSFFWMILQAHLLACVFKLVSTIEGDARTSELLSNFNSYSEKGVLLQYMQAADYSMKTMSGLSRGRAMPVGDLQHAYALVTTMTGIAAYSFLLAAISNMLQVRSQQSAFLSRLDDVKGYLEYSKVPGDLQNTCVGFYKHSFATSGQQLGADQLDDLPLELHILVDIVTCRAVIARVPIFQSVRDNGEFVYALSRMLRSEVIAPGQAVTKRGARGSSMFFITHGEFQLDLGRGTSVLHSGNFFGEIALLHNVRRTATVTAAGFCNVLRLDKASFEELSDVFPAAMEKIRGAAALRITALIGMERASHSCASRESSSGSVIATVPTALSSEEVMGWVEQKQQAETGMLLESTMLESDVQDFTQQSSVSTTPKGSSGAPSSGRFTTFVARRSRMDDGFGSTEGMNLMQQRDFAGIAQAVSESEEGAGFPALEGQSVCTMGTQDRGGLQGWTNAAF